MCLSISGGLLMRSFTGLILGILLVGYLSWVIIDLFTDGSSLLSVLLKTVILFGAVGAILASVILQNL